MIKDFNYSESDLNQYKNEFLNRLPDKVIDNHVHLWPKSTLSITEDEYSIYKSYKPWTDLILSKSSHMRSLMVIHLSYFLIKESLVYSLGFPSSKSILTR